MPGGRSCTAPAHSAPTRTSSPKVSPGCARCSRSSTVRATPSGEQIVEQSLELGAFYPPLGQGQGRDRGGFPRPIGPARCEPEAEASVRAGGGPHRAPLPGMSREDVDGAQSRSLPCASEMIGGMRFGRSGRWRRRKPWRPATRPEPEAAPGPAEQEVDTALTASSGRLRCQPPVRRGGSARSARQGRASYTRLNGVRATSRKRESPPAVTTSRMRAGPACVPSASPTSWASDVGVHSRVEKP